MAEGGCDVVFVLGGALKVGVSQVKQGGTALHC